VCGARRRGKIVVPVVGIAILGYTIDKQVTGQAFPLRPLPVRGRDLAARRVGDRGRRSRLARRIGVGLAREEGLAADDAAAASGS
jgi:hypothetical protein